MNLVDVKNLCDLAAIEFADTVTNAHSPGTNQARIYLIDGSFIDVWYSLKLAGRYSYHWERRAIDGTTYRHDNAPYASWQFVATFPKHFHDGTELNVIESNINGNSGLV